MGVHQRSIRVLVAESEPPARPVISGVLPFVELPLFNLPMDIITVARQDTLLDRIAASDFDCLLVDADMAGIDPAAIARTVAKLRPGSPIVFVAAESPAVMRDLRGLGADYIPRNQVSSERLSGALWNAMRLKQAVGQVAATVAPGSHQGLDPLTGLHNRTEFFSRLEEAVNLAARERRQLALMSLDLNRFREVNETLSHKAGDILLEEVAGRLRTLFRTSDLIGRLGDDEFAILLQTGAALAGAVTTAGKLLRAMHDPFLIENHRFPVGVSIGISLFPTHGQNADVLARRAEIAMRAAKRDANGFVVYSGDDSVEGAPNLSMAHDLRNAISNDELAVHFQPLICMKSNRIHGVEALLRWTHPKHGRVPPDVFIPLAEQTGSIETLTQWVLNHSLEQWQSWQQAGHNLKVSVNLSPLTLHNNEFPGHVSALMKKWHVPEESLILEITESAIVSDAVRAAQTVDRLHALGVGIAIDDFGSGYSSLAHIRKLPISDLKIDKSYVMNMATVGDDMVIVRTLVELGHNLGLKVVAEGVEDLETWNLLQDLGCDYAQGYYMGRPMEASMLEAWLQESAWGARPAARARQAR